jgi:hypothetical protein
MSPTPSTPGRSSAGDDARAVAERLRTEQAGGQTMLAPVGSTRPDGKKGVDVQDREGW